MPKITAGGSKPLDVIETVDAGKFTPAEPPMPKPTTPASIARRDPSDLTDRTLLAAFRASEILAPNKVANSTLYRAPDSIFWSAVVKNDEVITSIINDTSLYFASIYGSENLAAMMGAEVLENPAMRDRTIATLARLRGIPDRQSYALGITSRSQAEALLARYLEDPTSLAKMNGNEQAAVASLASELLKNLQALPDTGVPEAFDRAVAVAMTGDVQFALTPLELNLLREVPGKLGDIRLKTLETPEYAGIGIVQVRDLGAGGVIVLDEDWAKRYPDKAFAIRAWLAQNYPDTDIQYGRNGAWGSLMDKFGIVVDGVTAPVGAAMNQIDELVEQWTTSPEDRREMAERADKLEQQLAEGSIPEAEVQKALATINQLRDEASIEVGWQQYVEDVEAFANPRSIGTGFGDALTRAMELYPGDFGYGATYASATLLANIVADPLNWALPILGGVRSARLIPKIRVTEEMLEQLGSAEDIARGLRMANPALDEAVALRNAERMLAEMRATGEYVPRVSNSWIQNAAYRMLARTPEELAFTKPFVKAQSRLWEMRARLGPDKFAVVMQRFGLSQDVARFLATTADETGMQLALTRAMTGSLWKPQNVDELVSEMNAITRRLDDAVGAAPAPPAILPPTSGRFLDLPAYVDDPGFAYHLTPAENLKSISREGLRPGVAETEVYFSPSPGDIYRVPPGVGPSKPSVVLRARLEDLREPARVGLPEDIGELSGGARFPAEKLEYLGTDGGWHPLLETAPDEFTDLLARRQWFADAINGRDWVRPMESVLTSRQFRRLQRIAGVGIEPTGPFDMLFNVLRVGTDLVGEFPRNVIRAFSSAPYRDPKTFKGVREWFAAIANIQRQMGTGTLLSFPHTSKYAKALTRMKSADVLTVEDSFQAVMDIGENALGIPRARMQELMTPWSRGELTSSIRSYDWWKATWTTMIDESPRLPNWAKPDLKQMWDSLVLERSPGYITELAEAGRPIRRPTLFRTVTDDITGEVTEYGVPVFTADQFQTFRTMSIRDLRGYLSAAQRTAKLWRDLGPGKRALSKAHQAVSELWTGINTGWLYLTLGARLFGALPMRIFNEQMLRLAGFGYSSAVWHPAEWFRSTALGEGRAVARAEDVALFFPDTPIHALGSIVDSVERNPNFILARAGRVSVTIADEAKFPGVYFRSYSGRLQRIFASPETNRWLLPYLDDPERAVVAMRTGRYKEEAADILSLYDEVGIDAADAVRNQMREIQELIGTGPGAEYVRVALRRGEVTVDDVTYRTGTTEFANLLKGMYERGEWRPGIIGPNGTPVSPQLARSAGDYLPGQREPTLMNFVHLLFRKLYTAPDLALSRSPLFIQMAARRYQNLIARGYSPERAYELARAQAARGTADLMFTVGAKTSGEWFLRNMNPFIPAWRELATTWLARIPQRVGQGYWLPGATAIARRADVWLDFFKNLGIIREDARGNPVVPLPVLAPIVRLLTGQDADFEPAAPVESLFGILPVPTDLFATDETGKPLPLYQRLRGLMPTIGAPAGIVLSAVDKMSGGALKDLESWVTLFGADQSYGPMAVDRLFEAFGITLPWMSGTTGDMHRAMQTWAVIDGMRLKFNEMPPQPQPDDFDEDGDGDLSDVEIAAYGDARRAWVEEWMAAGERYATGRYLLRGIASMILPFSVSFTDEGQREMQSMWALVDALRLQPGGSDFGSAYINSVLAAYPDLEPYMTGKTLDTRPVDDVDETLDEFMDAVRSGEVKIRSPMEWAVFSAGMNSYSVYQSKLNAIYEEAGENPAEWLVNFRARDKVAKLDEEWRDFLDLSRVEATALGLKQSFADMFEMYQEFKAARDGDRPRLSLEQEQLLEFSSIMGDYAKFFSPNPDSSEKYFKLREQAFDALEGAGRQSPRAQGVSWWFEQVSDPYYTKLDKLYDELDKTNDRDKVLVYQKIRDLAAQFNKPWVNKTHPEWGEFPSPEAYLFAQLDEADQRRQVTEWASLPATFLTEFQREQVGYTIPENKQDDANKLVKLMAKGDYKLDKWRVQNDLGYTSPAYIAAEERFQKFYAQEAEKAGLTEFWKELNQPVYRRVDIALGLSSESPAWSWAAGMADEIWRRIEDQGYSPSGTSDIAKLYHKWLVDATRTVRKDDAVFDSILTRLGVALGGDKGPLTHDDLILKLFFEVFNTSQAYYLDKEG